MYSVEWDHFSRCCEKLARTIKKNVKPLPQRLFGVVRGGLAVTCHLAYLLDIHQIYTIHPNPKFKDTRQSPLLGVEPGPGDIIIDDVYETGATFRELRGLYPETWYVVLYSKNIKLHTSFYNHVIIGEFMLTGKYLYLPFEQKLI